MGGQRDVSCKNDANRKSKAKAGARPVTPSNVNSVVVDGCEYIVEQSAPVAQQVLTQTSAPVRRKPPSDCSSSGIERTDTHSDTSSYASSQSRSALARGGLARPRKNVTFSDKVALVSTAPHEPAADEPHDYIAYVQALLKRSPGKRSADDVTHVRSATPTADALGKTGYDSDFDEQTDDSSGDDVTSPAGVAAGASDDRVQCNLCRKRLIDASQVFCENCSHYMSQFEPATSAQ